MQLYDAHNHLHDPRLAGRVEAVLADAARHGVDAMLVNATGPQDWDAVLQCVARHPAQLRAALGVHPWRVDTLPDDWDAQFARALDAAPAGALVALGEIGLDGAMRTTAAASGARQRAVFQRQLALARERGLPVVIHCVRAWEPLFEALRDEPLPAAGAMLHDFNGSPEIAVRLLDLGFHLSFSTALLQSRNHKMRVAARAVPDARLLIETDAPDRPPPPEGDCIALAAADGTPLNHPANLAAVAAELACVRDTTMQHIAAVTHANAHALFAGSNPGCD